jgi:hypothetical protein
VIVTAPGCHHAGAAGRSTKQAPGRARWGLAWKAVAGLLGLGLSLLLVGETKRLVVEVAVVAVYQPKPARLTPTVTQ